MARAIFERGRLAAPHHASPPLAIRVQTRNTASATVDRDAAYKLRHSGLVNADGSERPRVPGSIADVVSDFASTRRSNGFKLSCTTKARVPKFARRDGCHVRAAARRERMSAGVTPAF